MSIRCYAEGIEYGVMDPKQSSETILEETDLLSGMVEDILYIKSFLIIIILGSLVKMSIIESPY